MHLILQLIIQSLFSVSQARASHSKTNCRPGQYLPIFALGSRVPFPQDSLQEIIDIETTRGKYNITKICQADSCLFFDGEPVVGFTNKTSGETGFYPRLSRLLPGADDLESWDHVIKFLEDIRIFPEDDSTISAVPGSALRGAQKLRNLNKTEPPSTFLQDIHVRRSISIDDLDIPFCGPGSKAIFRLGSDAKIHSFVHKWRRVESSSHPTVKLFNQAQVNNTINAALAKANIVNATVESMQLCYYDNDKDFVQPVYMFTARQPGPVNTTGLIRVGYVAAADGLPEPVLESLAPTNQEQPGRPQTSQRPSVINKRQLFGTTVRLGRYTYSGSGKEAFIGEEREIRVALQDRCVFCPYFFISTQFYYEAKFIYTDERQNYIDSVDLAYTESHGNRHRIYLDDESSVAISEIGDAGGYGLGNLRYWFIDACMVIPVEEDYFFQADDYEAYEPWYSVFRGLHAVMGYRTESLFEDGVEDPLGHRLNRGEGVIAAWLFTNTEADAYRVDRENGGVTVQNLNQDDNRLGGKGHYVVETDWRGQPVAVAPCGHDDFVVGQLDRLDLAFCLRMWWYSDIRWDSCHTTKIWVQCIPRLCKKPHYCKPCKPHREDRVICEGAQRVLQAS